jgi:hypothetical protein
LFDGEIVMKKDPLAPLSSCRASAVCDMPRAIAGFVVGERGVNASGIRAPAARAR